MKLNLTEWRQLTGMTDEKCALDEASDDIERLRRQAATGEMEAMKRYLRAQHRRGVDPLEVYEELKRVKLMSLASAARVAPNVSRVMKKVLSYLIGRSQDHGISIRRDGDRGEVWLLAESGGLYFSVTLHAVDVYPTSSGGMEAFPARVELRLEETTSIRSTRGPSSRLAGPPISYKKTYLVPNLNAWKGIPVTMLKDLQKNVLEKQRMYSRTADDREGEAQDRRWYRRKGEKDRVGRDKHLGIEPGRYSYPQVFI
jgi:hypothetical protein